MKKWLSLILAALLVAALAAPALADAPTVVSLANYKYSPNMNDRCNTFSMTSSSGRSVLLDANGNLLVGDSGGYTSMYPRETFYSVEVNSSDGVHDEGLIDGYDGHVVVPAKYADVEIISNRWQAGIKLTPSNADDKDYTFTFSNNVKRYYRIDAVDMYFDGQMVGTLTRSEYHGGYATAHGAFLTVTNMAKEYVAYDSHLVKSPITPDYSSTEYTSERRSNGTIYYHVGSGQEAFVPSCTLTEDDVDRPFNYVNGRLYDLQGNVLFTTIGEYTTLRNFYNGYAIVYKDSFYGLINTDGQEVVPLQYKSLGDVSKQGYVSAQKDGKFGYVDVNGNETCPFTYNADVVHQRGNFAYIQDLDGTYIVLSAAVGVLPEHYAEVDIPYYTNNQAFVAKNSDNEITVVDLYGNTLLPYTNTYGYFDLAGSGTLAVAKSYETNNYVAIQFQIPDASAQQTQTIGGDQTTALVSAILGQITGGDQTQAEGDGSWTCENGHGGNTGNFCTECGAAKPAEAKPAFCASCGFAFGENVPNFCPNCGAATK